MMFINKPGQEGVRRDDPLGGAAGATALVLALNKPVYPLYVWFLAESAFHLSLLTALTMPLYLAVWHLSRIGKGRAARLGMVIVGVVDTLAIAFVLGGESETLAFLFACLMLAGLSFYRTEVWLSRGLVAAIFVLFVVLEGRIGAPLMPVAANDMRSLAFLNVTGAAALAAFIMLRFPRAERPE
ncbi:hypothetical protein AZF01_08940 [Martelella sp. AD-3]|nr:hypothetical protein AZF01_08940 [Martelella sp. AD-3]